MTKRQPGCASRRTSGACWNCPMSVSRTEVRCISVGVTRNAQQSAWPLRMPEKHSVPQLVTLVEEFLDKGIGLRALQGPAVDSASVSGELMFSIFASLTRFQKGTTQEHKCGGLPAARTWGRLCRRRAVSAEEPGAVTAKRPHKDRSAAIARKFGTLGTSRPSFLRDSALGLYAA